MTRVWPALERLVLNERAPGVVAHWVRSVVRSPQNWSESDFVERASATLMSVADELAEQDVNEAEYAQGVLTLVLKPDKLGTYVLNLQTPNRQIWMSSPVSGPWRYHWDEDEKSWKSTRDNHALRQKLAMELADSSKLTLALIEDDN